jgi:hypothetical protein
MLHGVQVGDRVYTVKDKCAGTLRFLGETQVRPQATVGPGVSTPLPRCPITIQATNAVHYPTVVP